MSEDTDILDGSLNKRIKTLFSESKTKYKVFTHEFDEIVKAEDLETE